MALASPRFRWNSRLREVEGNDPAMRRGESGHAVRQIQQAMIDLGIDPLSISIRKYGTVDGAFGGETVRAVKKYQHGKSLKDDGVVGQKTMQALDVDLPTGSDNLPPLSSTVQYIVHGAISIFDQVAGGHHNGCWAYSYAMMLSWKRGVSIQVEDALAEAGEEWVTRFRDGEALSHSHTARFYRDAGMRIEPMRSYSMPDWIDLLRSHGPMTIHGVNNSLTGGHVRVIYGVTGDGSPRRTAMMIVDPWNGREYQEPYERFMAKYEGGGDQAKRTAQLAHW